MRRHLSSNTCVLALVCTLVSPSTAAGLMETVFETVSDASQPLPGDWVNGKEAWREVYEDDSTAELRSFFYHELGVVCAQKNVQEVAELARAVLSSFAYGDDWCLSQWHDHLAAMNSTQLRHALSQVLPHGGATLRIRPRTLVPYMRPPDLVPLKSRGPRNSRPGNRMLMERATQRCLEEVEDNAMEALYKDGLLAAFDRDFVEESLRQLLPQKYRRPISASPGDHEATARANSLSIRDVEVAAEAMATHVGLDLGPGNMPLEVHTSLACVRLKTLAPNIAKPLESNNQTSQFQATCAVAMAYTRAVTRGGAQVDTVARAVELAAQHALQQQPLLPPLPFGWFAPQNKPSSASSQHSWWGSKERNMPEVSATSTNVNRLSKGAWRLINALLAIDEQNKERDHLPPSSAGAADVLPSTPAAAPVNNDGRRLELRRRFYFAPGTVHDCSFALAWANVLQLTVQRPERHLNHTLGTVGRIDLVTFEHVQGRPGLCVVRWRGWSPSRADLLGEPSLTKASLLDDSSPSPTSPLQFSTPKWVDPPPLRLRKAPRTISSSTENDSVLGSARGSSLAVVVPFHTNEFARVVEWVSTMWPRPPSSSSLLNDGDSSAFEEVRRLRCDVPVVFACSGDLYSIMAAKDEEHEGRKNLVHILSEAFEPHCIDTTAFGIGSDALDNQSSSRSSRYRSVKRSLGGVYLLSMHQAERLGHYDGAAATFFDLFPVLSPHFEAFQLMETDVVPLREDWAEKLEVLVSGRRGRREELARRKPAGEGVAENDLDEKRKFNDEEGNDNDHEVEYSGLFQAPCIDWWQIGSSALCNPTTTTGTSSAPIKRDFHLNGNALYALGCAPFDEYRTLVQRFYPARGGYGRGRCVEVGGCEAGVTDEAIGYDRALHDYRVHPLNFHFARLINSKFVHLPEYSLINFCEDAVELASIQLAYPNALLLHTKGLTRQGPGAREVHRLVVGILQRPPTAEEVARYAPLWDNNNIAPAHPIPPQQSQDNKWWGWVSWLSPWFKGAMTSPPPSSTHDAKEALLLELCASPDLPDRATLDYWECSHHKPKLASKIAHLRAQVEPMHQIYRQLLNRPARGPSIQGLADKWRSAGWWSSQRRAAIVQQICTNHEYLSAGGVYSFATGFRPMHVLECARFCDSIPGYATGDAARACAATAAADSN